MQHDPDLADDLDLFEVAILSPAITGLPMTVWVSRCGREQRDARVKVSTTHGNTMDVQNTAVVGIRPGPTVIEGRLTARDFRAVSKWIDLNSVALLDYCDGIIDTAQLIGQLRRVRPSARTCGKS